jgi:hypothetical protein
MTTLRVQVSLPNNDTIPRDAVVNVWHFESNSGVATDDAIAAVGQLQDFYDSIDGFLSNRLNGDILYKVYDLVDISPRAPIYDIGNTITPDTTQSLPTEVAICLSYRAALISGFPRGRARGRIFLGPFSTDVLATGTGGAILESGVETSLAAAGGALIAAGEALGARWVVFSPTSAGAEPWSAGDLTLATLPVDNGWVDNAFDTQRSRGLNATSRTTF